MRKPTIKSIEIKAANIPLNNPVIARIGTFSHWAFMTIEIKCSDNTTGKGYIGPYLIQYAPAIAMTMRELFKQFEGREIAPYQFFNEGMKSLSLLGRSGIALYALAGLDIAFWDAEAKVAGVPLCVHLGGSISPVKSYNSNGLWLKEPESLYDETLSLLNNGGFEIVKVRLGRPSLSEDLKAVENVRKALGAERLLLSDFNQGLSLPDAIMRLKGLDNEGLYWFEEPVVYHDFDAYKELRRRMNTPIMMGENFHGPDNAMRAMKDQICDFIMPDLMRIGGVSGWVKTASIAESFGIQVSTHLFPEVSSHLMRVTPTAHLLEWTDWAELILVEPYKIEKGHIVIPEVPGTGIEFKKEVLEKYKVEC